MKCIGYCGVSFTELYICTCMVVVEEVLFGKDVYICSILGVMIYSIHCLGSSFCLMCFIVCLMLCCSCTSYIFVLHLVKCLDCLLYGL